MKIKLIVSILLTTIFIRSTESVKHKNVLQNRTVAEVKNSLEKHEDALSEVLKHKTGVNPIKITNVTQAKIKPFVKKEKKILRMISTKSIENWAQRLSEVFFEIESKLVKREELLSAFSDAMMVARNGTALVNKAADALEDLLTRRVKAAENIMRKAEELDKDETPPPDNYVFDHSVDLDKIKEKKIPNQKGWFMPQNCTNLQKVPLNENPKVMKHIYWTEGLLSTFKKNYAQDATTDFQYFCSAKGFLRHYPAALWDDMHQLKLNTDDVYDCRLRSWYVSAGGAPRDVLVLLDASGSMNGSSNQVIAEEFTLALLSALTDDDQVNVLYFNEKVNSLIQCFNQKMVPANHVNSAAMMEELREYTKVNETKVDYALKYAIKLLRKQRLIRDRPKSCQQAIVLLTDSMYDNYTDLVRHLDPGNNIRLFVFWLHDRYGLRDDTRRLAEWLSCARDGYFAELITHADVTEQVMSVLRVLERPLVAQRDHRLRVFSDIYAHIEVDPRRSEYHWTQKENAEQLYRYKELRKDKRKLLDPKRMYEDWMHQWKLDPRRSEYHWTQKENAEQLYRYKELRKDKRKLLDPKRMNEDWMHQWKLNEYGQYYEGEELNYRLEISVSMPVFDATTAENITIQLMEYPVNRLLGVAGVDIPIDHLKLILPYHQLGAGGSIILVDHRGNVVLHDNLKPTFDGDVLRPGYRTVDFLDLEQPAVSHLPRQYLPDWLKFRRNLIIDKETGNMTMYAKNIYEDGMRATLENRQYFWRRVLDHYTVVVALPTPDAHWAGSESQFTMKLAEAALKSLSRTDFAVQPDWWGFVRLYCRHVEPHFDSREAEVLHFIRRRSDEPNFAMKKLNHIFSPIPPLLLEKTYQCDEGLMARLCKDAIATDKWAREHEHPHRARDCSTCELGSITTFFASENGLTRWQVHHATSEHAAPVEGSVWARGPREAWYRRAAHRPAALHVHAPARRPQLRRNSFAPPPPVPVSQQWLTAARALTSPDKGIIGVTGFHFYPSHLDDLLNSITKFPCAEEDEESCEVSCDGETWMCVVVDEAGWVVAPRGGAGVHLAALHPAAMAALLNASVYQLNWLHDYQSVCFTSTNKSSAALMVPSILKSLWRSIALVLRVAQEFIGLLTIVNAGASVAAETVKEKMKRSNRLRKNYEADQFESLYDDRVLVNRTRFAACDRTRPLYQLQHTRAAADALRGGPHPCRWPLAGALVPRTNLLLLALYRPCAPPEPRPPHPQHNRQDRDNWASLEEAFTQYGVSI
ncbi:uncharacterized protein LOC114244507 [Bombyx mandarina]|uniref:Uncharacterized protein LOC114244507 n=1 Tax=Bombyx mandarina TaxID=7092 RepID=A0A6J2JRI3_BOMMA|nr:uncharacterized protein LOC114244507 [Bombyx mandarina]